MSARSGSATARAVRGVAMIDRDDTLIRDVPDLADPSQIEMLSTVVDGIEVLGRAGLWLALVTNQGAIARGVTDRAAVDRVNQRLSDDLRVESGFGLDSVHICPHHPTVGGPCDCRKPGTGMLVDAIAAATEAAAQAVPPGAAGLPAWMIGNSATDMLAGLRLGVGAILVTAPERRDSSSATDILTAVDLGRTAGDLPTESIVVVDTFVDAARLVAAEVAA